MEIQTMPGYEADEITVVYRRKIDGSKAIRVLPPEESQKLLAKRTYRKSGRLKSDGTLRCRHCEEEGYSSRRSLGQHERQCKKNPNYVRQDDVGAADPAAARKFIKDLLKCPYCQKKCKNERGLGVHKAFCDKNPNKKSHTNEGPRTPAGEPASREWSDDDDLYLSDHFKDSILSLLEHFNCPEREIRRRIDHLKKTGLIKEEIKPESPLPGFMKKAIDNFLGRQPEDNTPIEVGAKLWDFKYHEGKVVTVDMERKVCTVEFPSVSDPRKFNFEGTRKMIKEFERRSQPHNDGIGVDHG